MADREGALVQRAAMLDVAPASNVQQAHGNSVTHGNLALAGRDVIQNYYHAHPQQGVAIIEHLRLVPNLRRIHLDVLAKATPGTAIWILRTEYFLLWLDVNGDLKVLWGTGIPGAGKSVMASVVINDLEARAAASEGSICVAYLYFRYSDASDLTVRGLLEILVKQTVERHSDCAALAEQAYARHIKEGTHPTQAELLQLLRQFAEVKMVTFYILDALDEAPEKLQVNIVTTLASLDVKLFITSRPLKAVEAKIPDALSFTIVAQDDDLDLLISQEISRSRDLQELLEADPSFKKDVVSSVKRNCHGMFLHASLQLDAISRCTTAQDISDTLDEFPSDIKDVYQQTWDRISNQTPKNVLLAREVLIWVFTAIRPMTIEELRHAVATHPDTHKFERKRLASAATLLTLCCGLVIAEDETKLVRLIHYTAKDALRNLLHEPFPYPHSLLAAICMAHLTECGFQDTKIGSEEELTLALQCDPLLAYASEAWAAHAQKSLDTEDGRHQAASFVTQCKGFPCYTYPDCTVPFDILAPLHVLAKYNLPFNLIPRQEIGNPNITTRVEKSSPLMLASLSKNTNFVGGLLTVPQTEINITDKDGYTALMFAAFCGAEDIARVLLANSEIRVNLVNYNRRSALATAARYGHKGIVEALLGRPEIEVNLVDNEGWSALMLAAANGHEDIAKALLARLEIQVNLVNDKGWSALMLAIHYGHEGIVKALLEWPEIQVNLVNNEGWSALMLAARYEHEGITQALLARPEIQVNLVDHEGWSALMKAAANGHEGISQALLARPEIQVNLVSHEGWSALMLAARFGRESIVQLLLSHPGAQVYLTTPSGETALTLSTAQGHSSIVDLLSRRPCQEVAPDLDLASETELLPESSQTFDGSSASNESTATVAPASHAADFSQGVSAESAQALRGRPLASGPSICAAIFVGLSASGSFGHGVGPGVAFDTSVVPPTIDLDVD